MKRRRVAICEYTKTRVIRFMAERNFVDIHIIPRYTHLAEANNALIIVCNFRINCHNYTAQLYSIYISI